MKRVRQPLTNLQLKAKARLVLKLADVREALIAAGFRTAAQQAHALGVSRSTAWALLNRGKRVGPSAVVLKRILSSPNLPPAVRRKVEEYIKEKIAGRYAHDKRRVRWFRDQFPTIAPGTTAAGAAVRQKSQSRSARPYRADRRPEASPCSGRTATRTRPGSESLRASGISGGTKSARPAAVPARHPRSACESARIAERLDARSVVTR